MAWRQDFLDWLALDTRYPVYVVETVDLVNTTELFKFAEGRPPMRFASAPVGDGEHAVVIDPRRSSISHGQITPGEWRRSYGQLVLHLIDGVDPRAVCTRGQPMTLMIGAAGWTYEQFEHVWLGSIRQIRYIDGHWIIEAVELPGTLQNRWGSTANAQSLFHDVESAGSTLAADYDPGTDITLQVASALDWDDLPPDADDDYALRVHPTGDEPYVVLAAAHVAGLFGGLNDQVFGTDASAATAGDTVNRCAYSDAHPIRIAARVLSSSGTSPGSGTPGINGDDDLFPVAWGYGIRPHYIDRADMDYWVGESGTDANKWRMIVTEEQADGLAWLSEWLRPGGFHLGLHQGALTVRAALAPRGRPSPGTVYLTDDDIVALSYQTWDDLSPVEYRVSRAASASGLDTSDTSESSIATRPSKARRRRDVLGAWDLTIAEGVAAIAVEEVSDRLSEYDTRVPERVIVTTAGWRGAAASIGDLVYLTTDQVVRRFTPAVGSVFEGTAGLMVAGGPDWFGDVCTFELLFTSPYSDTE